MDYAKDFIDENEHLIEELCLERVSNSVSITIPKTTLKVFLNENDLIRLNKNELLTSNKKFKYHQHYGFSFEDYGEYFLGSNEDVYSFYDLYGNAGDVFVEFDVSTVHFEFSPVSDICRILIEPFIGKYHYTILDRGLGEYFFTLKIYNCEPECHKDFILKGLYYLNTFYLKRNTTSLSVYHMFPIDFDFALAEKINTDEISDLPEKKTYKTKKSKTNKDFISIEPLHLFIHAQGLNGVDRFLGFYRVLEYFFSRSQEYKIEKLRYKKSIKSFELLKEIKLKDEKNKLVNLLEMAITAKTKVKLIHEYNNHCIKGQSITSFKSLSEKIYNYRCSIVHAKEEEILKTTLPDIFFENCDDRFYYDLVNKLAELCINKFNLVSKNYKK
jgi:hypothetical protein